MSVESDRGVETLSIFEAGLGYLLGDVLALGLFVVAEERGSGVELGELERGEGFGGVGDLGVAGLHNNNKREIDCTEV